MASKRYSDEVVADTADLIISWHKEDNVHELWNFHDLLTTSHRITIEFSLGFLSDGEQLYQGILCKEYIANDSGPVKPIGILWITSERIIYVMGSQIREFPSLAAPASFLVTGRIFKNALIKFFISTALASGEVYVATFDCTNYPHHKVSEFVDTLNTHLKELKNQEEKLIPKKSEDKFNNDYIAGLERLATLWEQGFLTDEEFKLAKDKLLKS
jgi:hypothetical protein